MSTTATHQVPATYRRLTLAEIAYAAVAVAVLVCGAVFLVQLIAGWFAPTTDLTDGVCRQYANHTVVCAPAYSPDGAGMTHMWEDGSAVYSDGHVFGGYSETGRPVVELDDLAPAEAAAQAAELDGQGWVRIPGECDCWTPA
jgi:hypothetical protein